LGSSTASDGNPVVENNNNFLKNQGIFVNILKSGFGFYCQ
jgi:hypothetical protein